ncbi:hypothetical protein T484DRAFT_3629858, partial [Baffinella frigidus]
CRGRASTRTPPVRSCRPEAGPSFLRRAHRSRGGPIVPEAGPSFPRRVHRSRDGPIVPEAGPSFPRRAHRSRGGPNYRAAGLSVPRRAYLMPLQGYLAHKKPPPHKTLQQGYASRALCWS